ncbi:MAG TPA: hypothetical protein VGO93_28715 [Candidatus Xenobia bacterium]
MQDHKAVVTVLQECWTVHKLLREMLPGIKLDAIHDSDLRRVAMHELPELIHDQEELIEKRIRDLGSELQRVQGSFVGFAERIQTGSSLTNLCAIAPLLCSMDHALLACSLGNGDHATATLAWQLANQSHELEHLMWPLTLLALGHQEQVIPASSEARAKSS